MRGPHCHRTAGTNGKEEGLMSSFNNPWQPIKEDAVEIRFEPKRLGGGEEIGKFARRR